MSYLINLEKVKQIQFKTPVFILLEDEDILFVKRGSKGLLSYMWGLPIIEETVEESDVYDRLIEYFEINFNISLDEYRSELDNKLIKIGMVKHVFSHRIWHQHVYKIELKGLKNKLENIEYPEIQWSKSDQLALPTAFKKSLECLASRKGLI